jgi:hypothetical protein
MARRWPKVDGLRLVWTVLGMFLGILWVVGLAHRGTPWIAWPDGLAMAIIFMYIAWNPRPGTSAAALCSLVLSAMVGPLFFFGLITYSTPYLVWGNFIAAGAFFAMFLLLANRHAEIYRPHEMTLDW